jgi:hypothetical protein
MRMPGFTGESALSSPAQHYRLEGRHHETRAGVHPAQWSFGSDVICGRYLCGFDWDRFGNPAPRWCWRCFPRS